MLASHSGLIVRCLRGAFVIIAPLSNTALASSGDVYDCLDTGVAIGRGIWAVVVGVLVRCLMLGGGRHWGGWAVVLVIAWRGGARGHNAGRQANHYSVRWPLRGNSGYARCDRGTIFDMVPLGSCCSCLGCCRRDPNGGGRVGGVRRGRGNARIVGGR